MKPGDKITRCIDSKKKWNEEQSVPMIKGAKYRITANKKQQWKDSHLISYADGINGNLFNKLGALLKLKRHNASKWMCLMGSLNKTKPCVEIGMGCEYKCPESGKFYFFANDAWWFYGNNCGKIEIAVERIY